jgi:hypothetical protein
MGFSGFDVIGVLEIKKGAIEVQLQKEGGNWNSIKKDSNSVGFICRWVIGITKWVIQLKIEWVDTIFMDFICWWIIGITKWVINWMGGFWSNEMSNLIEWVDFWGNEMSNSNEWVDSWTNEMSNSTGNLKVK